MPERRRTTTRHVELLRDFQKRGDLVLASEYQRNAVWPAPAKAYLIDTILNDKPIPPLFFQRIRSPESGRTSFLVIDGQQRLRAIFDFLEGRVRLTQSSRKRFQGKKFADLNADDREQLLNYDLVIEELTGYSDADVRDMFVRMNKYVVKLSPQELRNAREDSSGMFYRFVTSIGKWEFWRSKRVFSPTQIKRMRNVEFAAELAILLIEGPQDKKSSIDLYYGAYRKRFPRRQDIHSRLRRYLRWTADALPDLETTRYRSPVDLYSLIGALDRIAPSTRSLEHLSHSVARRKLMHFERRTKAKRPQGNAARYVTAASRQTDNITPRLTRVDILSELLLGARGQ